MSWCFHTMLFYQTEVIWKRCKDKLLKDIGELLVYCKLPYYLGNKLTLSDIVMAPYFERMAVLKHYRDFKVDKNIYPKWYKWRKKVLAHNVIKQTLSNKNALI